MIERTRVIYHMTPKAAWEEQCAEESFAPSSLADEGFVHCTAEPERLLWVANHYYRDVPGPFVILGVVPERLEAEVRWEVADGHVYPHVYGPLNRSAVEAVLSFPRQPDDGFRLPPELKV